MVIIVKVPELLAKNNTNTTDLVWRGNIAFATTLCLLKSQAKAIPFEALESLRWLFVVGMREVFEYVPEGPASGTRLLVGELDGQSRTY